MCAVLVMQMRRYVLRCTCLYALRQPHKSGASLNFRSSASERTVNQRLMHFILAVYFFRAVSVYVCVCVCDEVSVLIASRLARSRESRRFTKANHAQSRRNGWLVALALAHRDLQNANSQADLEYAYVLFFQRGIPKICNHNNFG